MDANQPLPRPGRCPDCGAERSEGTTCEQDFHRLLGWETEAMDERGVVHHLTVLCYHLQHPGLYSPAGLEQAQRLLVDFLRHGKTPAQVRRDSRAAVDSGRRAFAIRGKPGERGAYRHPVAWGLTVADVAQAGPERYVESVQAWAAETLDALERSGNGQGG